MKTLLISGVVVAAVAIGGFLIWNNTGTTTADSKDPLDRTFTVKRDNLILGISDNGSVNSKEKHKLSMKANVSTKLLSVVDENTHVKEGDVLATFDAEDLKTRIEDDEVSLDNLNKELEVLLEQQTIQESTNAESLRTAADRLTNAEDALRKYRRYQLREERDKLDTTISNAEDALATARQEYDDYQAEIATTSSSDSDEQATLQYNLSVKEKAIETAQSTLESAESARKVFLRYDNPTRIKDLENAVIQATLNLEKVKVSTNSTIAQQQRQVANMKIQIRRRATNLEKLRSYMPMMELKAPANGVVLYGDVDARWGRVDVKTGMDVHRGMVLLTIPEMDNLVVDFDLPEIYRSKIDVGNEVIITPDSLQGVKYTGEIETLPVNSIMWDSNSPKIYKTKIKINDADERLVNGMKVQLQIVSGVAENVLAIPVESVFEDGNRYFVYKITPSGPQECDIELSRSNDTLVEITKGLDENDVIYLYRPFQKREGEE